MNLCIYTCFVYLQPLCITLDFKLFIDLIHILLLLYLLLWFWDLTIKNLQDFIKIYRALIKDIFLKELEGGKYVVRSGMIVLVQRGSQVVMARCEVAIFGSLGLCIYGPASRHWLISYSPIHLT